MIYTAVICSSLSLVGSGAILVSYLITKSYRAHFYYFWVFHLAIADFFISAGGLYDWTSVSGEVCQFFAVVLGFGLESSFYFIGYIALILYYSTAKLLSTTILFKRSQLVVTLTYILILIMSFGPLFTGSYGVSSTFCWLESGSTTAILAWTIGEYYVPIVIITLLTTVLYCKIYFLYKEDFGFGVKQTSYTFLFLLVPIVYLVTNLVAITDRILVAQDNPTPWV